MKTLVALLLSMLSSPILLAQTSQQPKLESKPSPSITQKQIIELPKGGSYRPSLTLQSALKVAEGYIVKEKIDISQYYLFEVKFILYGDKDYKDPSWYFWWTHEDGALGHYVELVVSIKTGSVRRLTSM